MVGRGLLKKHFCKTSVKKLYWDSNKCQFPLFPLRISQWQLLVAKATRVLIRLEQKKKTQLFIPPAYRCYVWNLVKRIGFMASEMSFENVDGQGWMPAYTTSSPMSLRLRWANKMIFAPREDSDQPGHPPSLIRVFAVCMKTHWVLSYPLSALWRLAWASAQSDQSLRCPHEDTLGPQLPIECTVKTDQGRCTGRSASSLGAKVILLVLSWCHSKNASHVTQWDWSTVQLVLSLEHIFSYRSYSRGSKTHDFSTIFAFSPAQITFFLSLPLMWHSRLTPSKHIASNLPLPSIFVTWAYSVKDTITISLKAGWGSPTRSYKSETGCLQITKPEVWDQ